MDDVIRDADPKNALNAAIQGILEQTRDLEIRYRPVAKRAFKSADLEHRRQFVKSMNPVFGTDIRKIANPKGKTAGWLLDRGVNQSLESAIQANVDLIVTIPKQHLEQVHGAITQGMIDGVGVESIKARVLELNGHNLNRAKLIARDQMQKFNSVLSMTRQLSFGVEKYIWRASGDERTRPEHSDKNGLEFFWNSPPGDTGHPGEDINCRCTAEPVLDSLLLQN